MAEMSGVAPARTDLSGGSQRLVLVALVLGLVLGAGMVGLSWFLGRPINLTPAVASDASTDAAAACAALARVPALNSPDFTASSATTGPNAQVGFLRLSGAAALASAAGSADAEYRRLSSALNVAAQVIVYKADTRDPSAAAALAAARAACADH